MPEWFRSRAPIVRISLGYVLVGLAFMVIDFLSDLLPFGTYLGIGPRFCFGGLLVLGGVSLTFHYLLFYRLLRVQPHRLTTTFEIVVGGFSIVGGLLFTLLLLVSFAAYASDEMLPDSVFALLAVPATLVAYGAGLLLSVPLRWLLR